MLLLEVQVAVSLLPDGRMRLVEESPLHPRWSASVDKLDDTTVVSSSSFSSSIDSVGSE